MPDIRVFALCFPRNGCCEKFVLIRSTRVIRVLFPLPESKRNIQDLWP
jgi:hypothetical protein